MATVNTGSICMPKLVWSPWTGIVKLTRYPWYEFVTLILLLEQWHTLATGAAERTKPNCDYIARVAKTTEARKILVIATQIVQGIYPSRGARGRKRTTDLGRIPCPTPLPPGAHR